LKAEHIEFSEAGPSSAKKRLDNFGQKFVAIIEEWKSVQADHGPN
jgi:hypothetical protein